jgi:DNA-directed RNA polymerase subunit RPC12/RpoP
MSEERDLRDPAVLCPYCLSRADESSLLCPACGRDTSRDALLEMSLEEIAAAPRKRCAHCGGTMLALASVCAACRRDQPRV